MRIDVKGIPDWNNVFMMLISAVLVGFAGLFAAFFLEFGQRMAVLVPLRESNPEKIYICGQPWDMPCLSFRGDNKDCYVMEDTSEPNH